MSVVPAKLPSLRSRALFARMKQSIRALDCFENRKKHGFLAMTIFSVILTVLSLGLSSCGFHPRGVIPLAPPLHNLYLQTKDPYGQLAHNLRDYLKLSHVHLAQTPQEASVILIILKEETSQQLLSVGGTQQTRQYNLILRVYFQLNSAKGEVLLPEQSIVEVRTIPIQSNQILAGSNEANNLYRQMRQAAVYDIMNHLSAENVSAALAKSGTAMRSPSA